jgi:hypothetical protein
LAVLEQDYDLRDKEKIMPDIRTRVETVDNTGAAQARIGANFEKHFISQSDAGRELIVKISANAGILESELLAALRYMTALSPTNAVTRDAIIGNVRTGPDVFTIAAVGTANGGDFTAGTTTAVFVRAQGTGTLNAAGVKAAAEAADANGTTFTVTTEAVFQPRF